MVREDWPFGEGSVQERLRGRANWGRWGDRSQRGTINLIDAAARLRGVRAVRSGVSLSLARSLDETVIRQEVTRVPHNPEGTAGFEREEVTLAFHGVEVTHIDALSHVWDESGAWDDNPTLPLGATGPSPWGTIDAWSDGILTRGVLLDVAHGRPDGFVTRDDPVTPDELDAVRSEAALELAPGDALVINCGRGKYDAQSTQPWGRQGPGERRAGLHASCIDFIRDHDCSILVWDMMDHFPHPSGLVWGVHLAIPLLGLALVDNAATDALAETCRTESRSDFMLVVAPLPIRGGSGSPVNPLAVL